MMYRLSMIKDGIGMAAFEWGRLRLRLRLICIYQPPMPIEFDKSSMAYKQVHYTLCRCHLSAMTSDSRMNQTRTDPRSGRT